MNKKFCKLHETAGAECTIENVNSFTFSKCACL